MSSKYSCKSAPAKFKKHVIEYIVKMKLQREIFALLFIVVVAANIVEAYRDCFTSKDTFECRLGSMTPYRWVANRNGSQLRYSGCSPQKIWLLIRHGTRYPGRKWTSRMTKELPEIRDRLLESHSSDDGMLSDENVELFKKWKFKFSKRDIMKLTEEGERELAAIAKRFQSRFPTIMPETYGNETYKFKYTATQRTEESAKRFALGLFGPRQSLDVSYLTPEHRDPILRFYKSCKRWREEVDENPESYEENGKFVKGSVVRNLLDEVSKRVGFELDYGQIRLIYMICAFETAWYENYNSPWCNLLSLENFKVLEFAQDLQYYWIDGYGYSLTYEQACSAMKDVFDFFGSEEDTKASVYFTHSGTLLKLLAHLGIAKEDQALRHDSFDYEDKRAWRTSLIDSFASNIAFILYDCETVGPSVLVMHQERVVQLVGCPVERPCPLATMKEIYPDHEAECRFDEMCEN